jgi:hypothetical protein
MYLVGLLWPPLVVGAIWAWTRPPAVAVPMPAQSSGAPQPAVQPRATEPPPAARDVVPVAELSALVRELRAGVRDGRWSLTVDTSGADVELRLGFAPKLLSEKDPNVATGFPRDTYCWTCGEQECLFSAPTAKDLKDQLVSLGQRLPAQALRAAAGALGSRFHLRVVGTTDRPQDPRQAPTSYFTCGNDGTATQRLISARRYEGECGRVTCRPAEGGAAITIDKGRLPFDTLKMACLRAACVVHGTEVERSGVPLEIVGEVNDPPPEGSGRFGWKRRRVRVVIVLDGLAASKATFL